MNSKRGRTRQFQGCLGRTRKWFNQGMTTESFNHLRGCAVDMCYRMHQLAAGCCSQKADPCETCYHESEKTVGISASFTYI